MTGITAVILKGYPRLSETFIAQELRGLERLGHALVLYPMRQPRDATRHPVHDEIEAPVHYLPEYLRREPGRVIGAVLRLAWRPGFWRAALTWLGDLAREPTRNRIRRFGQGCVLAAELPGEVTRLHAHFIHTPASVTQYASMITGLEWTCSAHAKDIWTSPDWDLRPKLRSAGWVATCTAVGHAHLQGLCDQPGKVHLVYHGLDLQRFGHDERPASRRDGHDRQAPVRLISVGRAVEKKGFDTLLDALARLPADLHWRWTHIGGGDKAAELKQHCATLGLDHRVAWLGAQDQARIIAAYRASDLFVLPCRIGADGDRDGLPNVLVEAQSQGLACISTPISAIPELISPEVNGALVAPDNPDELAAAMARLIRNPGLRDAFGRAGEARVRSAFDHNVGIRQLDALFRSGALDTVKPTEQHVGDGKPVAGAVR